MLRRNSRSRKSTPKKSGSGDAPKPTHNVNPGRSSNEIPPAPSWFSWACAEPCDSLKVKLEDPEDGAVDIHCFRWGASTNKRGLLMVHGGGANGHWYRFVAPFFASEFDVVAITNSGNGDSGSRSNGYTLKKWSGEIFQVAEKLGLLDPKRPRPYILAHSLGTYATVNLLREVDFPGVCNKFGGAILADGAIRPYELAKSVHDRVLEMRKNDPTLQPRAAWPVYSPSVTPLSRFKLRPFQECENVYIMKFIADNSREIVDDDGCWSWKGDCNREAKYAWTQMPVTCDKDVLRIAESIPVAFIYGEDSLLCDVSVVEFVRRELGKHIGIVGIPCAAHHIWLDQPLPFISAVRGIFAGWPVDDSVEDETVQEEDRLRREALLESKL